jgi:hypothetical protein
MNVSITTSLANVTPASIATNGVSVTLNLQLLFSIYNATFNAPGMNVALLLLMLIL